MQEQKNPVPLFSRTEVCSLVFVITNSMVGNIYDYNMHFTFSFKVSFHDCKIFWVKNY